MSSVGQILAWFIGGCLLAVVLVVVLFMFALVIA